MVLDDFLSSYSSKGLAAIRNDQFSLSQHATPAATTAGLIAGAYFGFKHAGPTIGNLFVTPGCTAALTGVLTGGVSKVSETAVRTYLAWKDKSFNKLHACIDWSELDKNFVNDVPTVTRNPTYQDALYIDNVEAGVRRRDRCWIDIAIAHTSYKRKHLAHERLNTVLRTTPGHGKRVNELVDVVNEIGRHHCLDARNRARLVQYYIGTDDERVIDILTDNNTINHEALTTTLDTTSAHTRAQIANIFKQHLDETPELTPHLVPYALTLHEASDDTNTQAFYLILHRNGGLMKTDLSQQENPFRSVGNIQPLCLN